jgi:hypothetical protein
MKATIARKTYYGNVKLIVPDCVNLDISQKHYNGISEKVEMVFNPRIAAESFEQQIAALRSLNGHYIYLSNIQKTILGILDNPEHVPTKVELSRYDKMMQIIRLKMYNKTIEGNKCVLDSLCNVYSRLHQYNRDKKIENLIETYESDVAINAYEFVYNYMRMFEKDDIITITNECDRIFKATKMYQMKMVLGELMAM